MAPKFQTIDAYIASFPLEVRAVLKAVRETIRKAIPGKAEETISYQIPTFKLDGRHLIYFAGWKDHVSVYPTPVEMTEALERDLEPYRSGKASANFPLNKPVPYGLISRLVKARLKEWKAKAE
ncbi:MAG: DUF1801 domain-containing protein [Bauldia sp.]|nr:DUF1801 domain-containing protein [Bauldia sp.]